MVQSGVCARNLTSAGASAQVLRSVVVLGSPRNKCSGTGICMVTAAQVSTADWECPYLRADLFLRGTEKLCFRFNKKSRNAHRLAHHFNGKLFRVEDPYRLPLHLRKGLGLEAPLVVHPGVYPVVETRNHWLLEIDVR